jgi:hypothetical protein
MVYFLRGDFVKARAAAEEALRIGTTAHYLDAVGWALGTLGLLAGMDEHYQEARSTCQQAASFNHL